MSATARTMSPSPAPRLCCAGCGAPSADPRAERCDYCHGPLGALACSSCHSRLAAGVRFCPWCGHGTVDPVTSESDLRCPCGDGRLLVRAVPVPEGTAGGALTVAECMACHGIWLGRGTVEQLVTSHADDSLVLALVPGVAATSAAQAPRGFAVSEVRYRRCPTCDGMMNRVNFARISGIIVDVCKAHGTWFDVHELPAVLAFVRQGGLDAARRREAEALADERRRLERERLMRTAMSAGRGGQGDAFPRSRVESSASVGFFALLGELLGGS